VSEVKFGRGVKEPRHVVELDSGHYIVSNDYKSNFAERLCLLSRRGDVQTCFAGPKEWRMVSEIQVPRIQKVNGLIMASDVKNKRVLLVSPTLIQSKILLATESESRTPHRLWFDQSTWRVYISSNDDVLNSGEVAAFQLVQNYLSITLYVFLFGLFLISVGLLLVSWFCVYIANELDYGAFIVATACFFAFVALNNLVWLALVGYFSWIGYRDWGTYRPW